MQLRRSTVPSNPVDLFDMWFRDAQQAKIFQPEAMVVTSLASNGTPTARVVLLKQYDNQGFVFFTNYHSDKGQQLLAHPQTTLVFFWDILERQVRVEGRVEKTTPQESASYFATRPRESQIGAWASPQSESIPNRDFLEQKVLDLEKQYQGKAIPCPPHWGGLRIKPERIEFWQGQKGRLHDRLRYNTRDGIAWQCERLAP